MSVIITDLGSDIQFTFSGGSIPTVTYFTLNKATMRLKQDNEWVYITNSDSFNQGKDNKILKLVYSEVTSPVYTSNDSLFAGIKAMIAQNTGAGTSSGAGGGGNNTYSTAQGDFIATTTDGTKNITITGLSFILEDDHVVGGTFKKIDSSGDVSSIPLTNVSVSGGVVTLGDADDFASGDTVAVTLIGPDKAYDNGVDSQIVTVLNPDYAHYTSVEHLVDEANIAADTYRYIIPKEGYKYGSLHLKGSGGVTFTIWGSNDDTADDSADTGWNDLSTEIIGAASLVDGEQLCMIDTPMMPQRLMVKVVTSDATNAIDVWINKY